MDAKTIYKILSVLGAGAAQVACDNSAAPEILTPAQEVLPAAEAGEASCGEGKCGEGKCGAGKCGASVEPEEPVLPTADGASAVPLEGGVAAALREPAVVPTPSPRPKAPKKRRRPKRTPSVSPDQAHAVTEVVAPKEPPVTPKEPSAPPSKPPTDRAPKKAAATKHQDDRGEMKCGAEAKCGAEGKCGANK